MASPIDARTSPSAVAPARPSAPDSADGLWSRQYWISRTLYWALHAACGAVLFVEATAGAVALFGVVTFLRMFGVTAGYHRYFAHRTYRTGRAFQLLLAVLGCSAAQKGPLWWAGNHRRHHQFADRPGDVHSPKEGFWYSHQGWIFDGRWDETDVGRIRDFARYPELVWLNQWHVVPPLLLAVACYAIAGVPGLVWGFVLSTVVGWHLTYSINSLAHMWGTRRYDTPDTSRNNPLLALLTLGEGWHNNHHRYMSSTRQGFFWWEIDITYLILRGLAAVGLIRDLREPPASLLRVGRGRSEATSPSARRAA